MNLRPFGEDDWRALRGWLPSLAGDPGIARWADEAALREAGGRGEALALVEGGVAGLLLYSTEAPMRGTAHIRLLAVAPERRRLGIGSRAALALEERLARDGVGRIYVQVPSELGLAFYFWLRLGYQPLTQVAWPVRPKERPSIWMVRPLA